MEDPSRWWGVLTALGIGLLVGAERERRKGRGRDRAALGVRTFALVALSGAVAGILGDGVAAVVVAGVALAAIAAYLRPGRGDPGLTTEAAAIAVCLLGALAMRDRVLALAIGVAIALLLAARSRLHRFVRRSLDETELRDALLLVAAAAIVLPLLPADAIDPWGAVEPRRFWRLALLVMSLNAAGHVALRWLGPRRGLLLTGLAGGFVSSTATIAGMGMRARAAPAQARTCAGAALASNVGTVVQLVLVLAAVSMPLLRALAWPLLASGAVAIAGAAFMIRRLPEGGDGGGIAGIGRPFAFLRIVGFVALLAAVSMLSAWLLAWRGQGAMAWMLAASGLLDVHAAAAAAAQLVAHGGLRAADAAPGILAALTTNAIAKMTAAAVAGGRRFALRLLPGVVGMVAAFAATLAWRA